MERDGNDRPGNEAPKSGGPKSGKQAPAAAQTGKRKAPARARPYERPRGGPARPIAELVPQIGRAAFRRFGFVQSSVVTRWPEIVGERHAEVCAPESIRFPPGERSDGLLHLVVAPAHAPLIQHVIPEIIERVNRFFGYRAVVRVKLRQGAVQPRQAIAARPAPQSLRPIPVELGDSLRDIGDPELRAVLESLARSLGHAKTGDDNGTIEVIVGGKVK